MPNLAPAKLGASLHPAQPETTVFTTRPEIAGTFGVVASTHWLATAVGMAVLERGGNAFDAAAATAFTLQVAEPHLNGPGGDAPIIIHDAKTGAQRVICGQGPAPARANIAHFFDLGLDLIPGTGLLPAVIPGAFGAWCMLLRDWGTWELADILEYAIGYAQNGVPLVPRVPATIESVRPLFEAEWPSSAAVFLPGGNVPGVDALFANPALAATYRRVLSEAVGASREARIEAARKAWYQGFVAEAIDGYFGTAKVLDASGRRHGGLLSGADMAAWSPTVEAPAAYDYHGHTVLKCGPWSQGPVFLQQLALLKGFDIGAMDPVGPDFVHTVVECAKLAYADREAFYGDPDFSDVPMATLLSAPYNAARQKLVGAEASMRLRPGAIDGQTPWVDHEAAQRAGELTRAAGVGEPTVARLGVIGADTVHIDTIDRWGNMVSATPSGGWLQSSPVVPGLGFPMGTRGQMFWLRPGLPNSLVPGKRPRTTLSPSFALRDGKPWMAFGTPGGEQQDQWSLTFFLRMVHHRMGIQQAIDTPSFHTEHWPSSFWPRIARPGKVVLEGRMGAGVRDALLARGHLAELGEEWSEGRISGARTEGAMLYAGANPRGMQGYAAGR
jgi:gamma-glutamyltranspeptidase/glutathione hydrolase